MIRVLMFGIAGRMGRIAGASFEEHEELNLVGGIERPDHPEVGATLFGTRVLSDDDLYPDADVWLDFSLAGPAVAHAAKASALGKPILIAATGFDTAQEEELTWHARRCPLMLAPNLSIGIGALESLALQASRLLPKRFESGIIEVHHSGKKDAPSGTARRIAERMTKFGSRPGMAFIRAGGAVGEHQIRFVGEDEELVLTHRAWTRRAFASGVPRALKFIARQQAGLYTPEDIFGAD